MLGVTVDLASTSDTCSRPSARIHPGHPPAVRRAAQAGRRALLEATSVEAVIPHRQHRARVRDLDPLALGGIFDLSRFTPDNASVPMTRGAHTVE